MRLIGATSIVFALALTFSIAELSPAITADQRGQAIFRYDTFGDEQLWTDVLRMHEVIATVPPTTALAVGLKVDVEALPPEVKAALRAGEVDLTNPAVTVELLRLNAVVGSRARSATPVAHQRRNHLRALPLVGRQLVCARDWQTTGRMGQHRPERGGNRRPFAGARCGHQGRVQCLGPRQI